MTVFDRELTLGTGDGDDSSVRGRPATSRAGRGSTYAELSRQVRQAGLLDRRPGYYAARIGLNAVMLAAATCSGEGCQRGRSDTRRE